LAVWAVRGVSGLQPGVPRISRLWQPRVTIWIVKSLVGKVAGLVEA